MPDAIAHGPTSRALADIVAPLDGANTFPQSALSPAGREAESLAGLFHVLWIGSAVIWVVVLLVAAFVVVRKGRHPERWGNTLIWSGGIVFPVLVLATLLPVSFAVLADIRVVSDAPRERILVNGHLWWWEFVYDAPDLGGRIPTANELVVPVGEPVEVVLASDNVIHSFWVPSLAGKMDLIPGRTNRMVIEATRPGVYRGQCAEFCGASHAWMAFDVRALPAEEYRTWLREQAAPWRPPAPVDTAATNPVPDIAAASSHAETMRQGLALFLSQGCDACHAIRGTVADGDVGPDLTHVGSRATIAAGLLPNNVGTLAGWIANAADLKPDSRMPSFNTMTGPELRTLATFLSELH